MKKFLITHNATVGRTTTDGAVFPPVELTFYSMVESTSSEEASSQVVQYSDPGFVTKVANITEVADSVSAEELFELLNHKKVLIEAKV